MFVSHNAPPSGGAFFVCGKLDQGAAGEAFSLSKLGNDVICPMLKIILFKAAVAMLRQLTHFNKEDFEWTVDQVVSAENNTGFKSGDERRKWVRDRIKKFFTGVAPFASDLLLSLAVGYANKAGMIGVRNKPINRLFTDEEV